MLNSCFARGLPCRAPAAPVAFSSRTPGACRAGEGALRQRKLRSDRDSHALPSVALAARPRVFSPSARRGFLRAPEKDSEIQRGQVQPSVAPAKDKVVRLPNVRTGSVHFCTPCSTTIRRVQGEQKLHARNFFLRNSRLEARGAVLGFGRRTRSRKKCPQGRTGRRRSRSHDCRERH